MSSASSEVVTTFHDGRKLLKDGRVVTDVPAPAAQVSKEIESGRAASATLQRMHRRLGDLPDIPQKMNPVAAVILYTCVGLPDADIATALGATEAQIATIKESELYSQLYSLFDRTVFDDAKRNARHIVARASDKAALKLVDAMDSNSELLAFKAAQAVTQMAGISLENTNESKLSGLQIRITRKEDSGDDITVEVK